MEPHMNGPLFTEMHVYHKILKEQQLSRFKNENGTIFVNFYNIVNLHQI